MNQSIDLNITVLKINKYLKKHIFVKNNCKLSNYLFALNDFFKFPFDSLRRNIIHYFNIYFNFKILRLIMLVRKNL